MNKKILIIDGNVQVPVQLESKFHEIIAIPNTEDLLKVTNVDAGTSETINNFNTELNKYINRGVQGVFNAEGIKKFKFNRELLLELIFGSSLYQSYFNSKYNLDSEAIPSMLSQLRKFSTVKAKYEREFKSNPQFETIRLELDEINKLIVNYKRASVPEYKDYSEKFISLLGCIESENEDSFHDQITMVKSAKNVLKAVEYADTLRARYSDISSSEITKKQLYNDIKDQKLADKLFKYTSLFHTLHVVPKLANLKPNDYLVVGESAAKVINKFNNLGLRKTTLYYQLLALKVCKTGTGANIVFIRTLSGAQTNIAKMSYFFSPDFAVPLVPEMPPKGKRVITNSKNAIETLQRLISMPVGSQFGFDYETNGKEINTSQFEMIGWSIANTACSVYFDIRYIKLIEGNEASDKVLSYLKQFLDKHATSKSKSKTWVFNFSFEEAVSYKLFDVFYEFWDLVVYRNITGHHMEWWSLKYTAQFDLRIRSWDDNYDGIMDIIFSWLFKWNPSLGKKGDWELRDDRDYFMKCLNECTDERITPYKDEFVWLYDHGYNTQFTCIPAALIGGYGALDSYYTVWGAKMNEGKYDDRCELTFMDNIRMGARLTGKIGRASCRERV